MSSTTAARWSREHRKHPAERVREARDFAEAVRFYRDAIGWEARYLADPDAGDDPGWRQADDEAAAALAIWRAEQAAAAERAVARMRAAGLDVFADAIEAGDFALMEF